MGTSYIVLDYRKFIDDGEKIIYSFSKHLCCYILSTKNVSHNFCSDFVMFLDPFKRKVFTLETSINNDKTFNLQNTIRLLLENIVEISEKLIPVYERDIDEVIHFKVNIDNHNYQALRGWKEEVAKKHNIGENKIHHIHLSDTMSYDEIQLLQPPDYRIIRSHYEDITLIEI